MLKKEMLDSYWADLVYKTNIVYKNDKLMFFNKNHGIASIASWPRLQAWRRFAGHSSWHGFHPIININKKKVEPWKHDPFNKCDILWIVEDETFTKTRKKFRKDISQFFVAIPPKPKKLVKRYNYMHWQLLNAYLRAPSIRDLFISNPALAFCLANFRFFNQMTTHPYRTIESRARKKQKAILHYLGFPQTQTWTKIFKKIAFCALKPSILVSLRNLLQKQKNFSNNRMTKLFQHCQTINLPLLNCLVGTDHFPPHINCFFDTNNSPILHKNSFYLEIGSDTWEKNNLDPQMLIAENAFMLERLGKKHTYCYRSIEHLNSIHQELIWETNRQVMKKSTSIELTFPPPPIQGNQNIIPITSPQELGHEGCEQNHCVGIYAPMIARGFGYVYRILAPERATLLIAPRGERYVIQEISGKSNQKVKSSTKKEIKKWLLTSDYQVAPPSINTSHIYMAPQPQLDLFGNYNTMDEIIDMENSSPQ